VNIPGALSSAQASASGMFVRKQICFLGVATSHTFSFSV
jgi:hypothetical protein